MNQNIARLRAEIARHLSGNRSVPDAGLSVRPVPVGLSGTWSIPGYLLQIGIERPENRELREFTAAGGILHVLFNIDAAIFVNQIRQYAGYFF